MRKRESGRIGGLRWMVAGVAALLLAAMVPGGARAQSAFDTFANTFQIHGYLENQTIERSDTFVRDWHNASLRNRLDVQLSGTAAKHVDLPGMPGVSIEYFLELRPGYEAAYDVDRDRFGNATTGFSGGAPGFSPFSRVAGLSLAAALIKPFGYNPKQFMMQGPKDYGSIMPVDPKIRFLPRLEGVCKHCQDVNLPLSRLRFEISSAAGHDYPVREAYFDIRWFWHGQNWLRLGKQQIVWGKADFFRLQDIVNNVDFAQHYNAEAFEDIRFPNWSASLQHRFGDIGPMHDLALMGVWNFDTFTPVGLGQGGQPWATHFGQALRGFAFTGNLFENAFTVPGFNAASFKPIGQMPKFGPHEFKMPDYIFKNMGYGAKLDWESEDPPIRFSVTDYMGEGDPVFKMFAPNIMASGSNPLLAFTAPPLESATTAKNPGWGAAMSGCLQARGIKKVPWAIGEVLLVTKPNYNIPACLPKGFGNAWFMQNFGADGYNGIVFHKHNTLGLSADYFDPTTGLVIRAESSWSHNVLINDTTSFDWTANNDVLQWVIGADSQFFIRPLNKERTFFGSAQVFAKYLPGASSYGRTGAVPRLSSYIFTAFLQTHYYRDRIVPLVFGAMDTLGTDAELGGNVEWLINNHWSAQIGSTVFLGKANRFDLTYDSAVTPGGFGNSYPGACPQTNPTQKTTCMYNQNRYTEQFFGLGQEPLGAFRDVYDEIWTRVRYRF